MSFTVHVLRLRWTFILVKWQNSFRLLRQPKKSSSESIVYKFSFHLSEMKQALRQTMKVEVYDIERSQS